jgi:hypothetical protein
MCLNTFGMKISYPPDCEVSEANLRLGDIVKFFSPEQSTSERVAAAGGMIHKVKKVSPFVNAFKTA